MGSPVLAQESNNVFWIGGYHYIKFGYGNELDLQILPGFFFICLEYLVE